MYYKYMPKDCGSSSIYWIGIAQDKDPVEDITKVGFDGASVKKGHRYVTNMVDLDGRRVLFSTEGKGAEYWKA
jgi:hypothetical protein